MSFTSKRPALLGDRTTHNGIVTTASTAGIQPLWRLSYDAQ